MKRLYRNEISQELAKYAQPKDEIFTEQDIASLPRPVQKYFHYTGYLGKRKMSCAQLNWQDTFIRLSPRHDWMSITYQQVNAVPKPFRSALIQAKMMGIFPLEGRDIYQEGQGNMLIKLAKLLKVADGKGAQMNQSALVTVLSEALIVPCYALQPYIRWLPADDLTAKAVITDHGIEASGTFTFNEAGEFVAFETDDRFYSETGKDYKKQKWSVLASQYIEKDGVLIPSAFQAVWHSVDGDFAYFKGTLADITFNIEHLL